MNTEIKLAKCPVCGRQVEDSRHSRIGQRTTPDGPIEYWACFEAGEVFPFKLYDDPKDDLCLSGDDPNC